MGNFQGQISIRPTLKIKIHKLINLVETSILAVLTRHTEEKQNPSREQGRIPEYQNSDGKVPRRERGTDLEYPSSTYRRLTQELEQPPQRRSIEELFYCVSPIENQNSPPYTGLGELLKKDAEAPDDIGSPSDEPRIRRFSLPTFGYPDTELTEQCYPTGKRERVKSGRGSGGRGGYLVTGKEAEKRTAVHL